MALEDGVFCGKTGESGAGFFSAGLYLGAGWEDGDVLGCGLSGAILRGCERRVVYRLSGGIGKEIVAQNERVFKVRLRVA